MSTPRRVIALGFFDGVHLGHGALLSAVTQAAQRLDAAACAFTFDRSPTAVITKQEIPLLSSVEDRIWLMRKYYNIQEVIVASFDAMQRMDWEDFIVQYLIRDLGGKEEQWYGLDTAVLIHETVPLFISERRMDGIDLRRRH